MEQLYKRFRFEMIEGDYSEPDYRTCEVACHFPDDVTWREVIIHFAKFLEGCGYVDVGREVDDAIHPFEFCVGVEE